MDLHPTEDQRMLQDAARRYLAERHPLSTARAACEQPARTRLEQWRGIAEQGWPALLAPAAHEGLGLGMREAWIVAEAAGRHLLGLPLAANMTLLPTLCEAGAGGPAPQWAAAMMAGETYYADAALRRAVIRGDGWMHGGGPPEELETLLDRINEIRMAEGKTNDPFEIHVISMDAYTVDGCKRLEDKGITDVIVGFRLPYVMGEDTEPLQTKIDHLNWYADNVIAKVNG